MPFRPEFNSPHLQNLKVDDSQSAIFRTFIFFKKRKSDSQGRKSDFFCFFQFETGRINYISGNQSAIS